MRVAVAYASVVLIWSTTPLAIQWSNSSLSFVAAVSLRMTAALVVCLCIMAVMRRPLVTVGKDWMAFAAGSIGLFPNMLIVYWSAQFIPSGLMAIILGSFPFTVGIFSYFILKENVFTVGKIAALIIAIFGLVFIYIDQMDVGGHAIYGVLGMLAAAFLWGLSSVWMKVVGNNVDSFRLSTGVLLVSTPGFIVSWYFMDGVVPTSLSFQSIIGVSYLVIAGSVLGGTLFFYVLKKCKVSTVSLITLITPVMSVSIGMVVQGEALTTFSIIGCILIISALAVYQGLFGYMKPFFQFKFYRGLSDA